MSCAEGSNCICVIESLKTNVAKNACCFLLVTIHREGTAAHPYSKRSILQWAINKAASWLVFRAIPITDHLCASACRKHIKPWHDNDHKHDQHHLPNLPPLCTITLHGHSINSWQEGDLYQDHGLKLLENNACCCTAFASNHHAACRNARRRKHTPPPPLLLTERGCILLSGNPIDPNYSLLSKTTCRS